MRTHEEVVLRDVEAGEERGQEGLVQQPEDPSLSRVRLAWRRRQPGRGRAALGRRGSGCHAGVGARRWVPAAAVCRYARKEARRCEKDGQSRRRRWQGHGDGGHNACGACAREKLRGLPFYFLFTERTGGGGVFTSSLFFSLSI